MTTRLEHVDGLALHTSGRGRPLVLLHGFTGSADAWPPRVLRALEDEVRVVRVDLPGHGAATVDPRDVAAFSVDRTVERLAAVARHLDDGSGPADWVGYSMGGRLALLAAVGGVPMRSLLLESASAGLADDGDRAERRRADEALARELETGEIADFVDRWMSAPLFRTQRSLPVGVRERERRRRLECDTEGLAAALRGFGTGAQPCVEERLGEVRIPVTCLTGALDEKFEGLASVLGSRLPVARRVSLDGVGHATHLEAPARWNRVVRDHLAWVEERR